MGKKKHIIGVDLGGTKMLVGLLDLKGKVLASEKTKVQPNQGEKYFLNSLKEKIDLLLNDHGLSSKDLLGIGIGSPGIIDPEKGTVLVCPNIPFLNRYPLEKKIRKKMKVPVSVGNDVNVGLLGEFYFGAARGYKHVIGIFPGTGVGGALVLNGQIYKGATGGAGEIGHMTVDAQGPLCGCGKQGCLEVYVGRLGIASEAAVLAVKQQAPKLFDETGGDIAKMKSGVLARAIKLGDKPLRQLIERRARILGVAMGNLVNLFSPELFVLGGGVIEAMADIILPVADKQMRQTAMEPLVKKVKVVPANLGDYAIIRGAAALIMDKAGKD